jgi:hypothetical protein
MDSEAGVADSESEIMDLLKAVHERNQTRISSGLVLLHSVFAAVAVFAFACVVVMRLCGVLDNSIVHKYLFACVTSVMFFAVGTFMVEYMRNDLFGGTLGRLLAACGLFVMSAQGYEFMQKSRAIEIEASILAKARPVSDEQTFIREITNQHFTVSFESKEDGNGWGRPVFSARGRSCSEDAGTARASRTADRLLRAESTGTATTNGTASF